MIRIISSATLNSEPDLQPSSYWMTQPQYSNTRVLIYSGWNVESFDRSWAEPISEEEFERRLLKSTVEIAPTEYQKINGPFTE